MALKPWTGCTQSEIAAARAAAGKQERTIAAMLERLADAVYRGNNQLELIANKLDEIDASLGAMRLAMEEIRTRC